MFKKGTVVKKYANSGDAVQFPNSEGDLSEEFYLKDPVIQIAVSVVSDKPNPKCIELVDCNRCNGKGLKESYAMCNRCNGIGNGVCIECGSTHIGTNWMCTSCGNKRINCPICQGKGRTSTFQNCTHCHGQGKVESEVDCK